MKTVATLLSIAAFANVAHSVTGTLTWQVSNDNGTTWSGVCIGTAGATIKVRLLASWTGVPPNLGVGFGAAQFDATLMGADGGNVVSNIVRPSPFNYSAQSLVASAINGGIKIDGSTDVLEPGLGPNWVNPGQGAAGFTFGFNSTNPAIIFTYDVLYGSQNEITIGSVINSQVGRAMAIYSNDMGTQIRLSSAEVTNIFAFIAPTPAPLVLMGLACITATRRRRTSSFQSDASSRL